MARKETSFDVVEPSPPLSPVGVHDSGTEGGLPEGFDELAYLEAYPDIAMAVRSGEWTSGLHHYRTHGAREDRLSDHRYISALRGGTLNFPPGCADRALISNTGECLVSGWVFDTENAPLRQITVRQQGQVVGFTNSIARCRRNDVEEAGPNAAPALSGFWALIELDSAKTAPGDLDVLITAGHERGAFTVRPGTASEEEFRDDTLRVLVDAKYFGDPETETFLQLDKGLGKKLIALNVSIVERLAQGAYQIQFGERHARYLGSIVVVLHGNADFLTLQAAFFSQCPGYDEYEFIYVSNSPELNDRLVRDATNASRIYGLAITLILLPGNAGFGVANNLGAAAAQSGRILFVNPDVLPRELYWPRIQASIVESLPAAQTALFGVPLYYGDGSLMHGGMYIDLHGGCSVQNGRVVRREILRVEHYGKGAPPGAPEYVTARAVPAVTGAFMSIDREWFERLGGFSPEFIFGHYEDVDLCLRSLEAGTPAWLHDLPFWHLESVGSKSLSLHDGGRLVNRWNLTEKWSALVRAELNGKSPIHFEK
jgi:GT2 family glycosyltransferase